MNWPRSGEPYGARVWKAETGRAFERERESAGVEWTNVGREFIKECKEAGTSEGVLGWLTVRASRDSIFVQHRRIVLPSSLALPSPHALASLLA
mmetsp:Transcript_50280/g.81201  ORF Transcript_50280/g.81201 Transcript_50280/m.81201 type:complete len:94 (-) Transcript_50280:1031-1312(-)